MDTDFHKDSPIEYKVSMWHPEEVKELAIFLSAQTVEGMTSESIDTGDWQHNLREMNQLSGST